MILRSRSQLLLVLFFINGVYSFSFEDAEQADVYFGTFSSNTQNVDVIEDNARPRVIIVKIVDVKSSLILTIQSGEADMNPIIEQIDGVYYVTGNRVDYETIPNRNPQLYLTIAESSDPSDVLYLKINVINIDDEPPTFTPGPCTMNETTPYTVDNSECYYTVGDPDGWLNYMKFEIIDRSIASSDIFELVYKTPPSNNTYEATVYLILQDGVELDYQEVTLYSFYLHATDSADHETTPPNISIIVQVIDLPNQPPIWIQFPYAKQITEKEATTLQVTSRDGDFGIDNPINFYIEVLPELEGNITIDTTNGTIFISSIDRDAGYDQVQISVTAYEAPDPTSTLTDTIQLLVQDIDDQIPKISASSTDNTDTGRPDGCNFDTTIDISDVDDGDRTYLFANISICERATAFVNLEISSYDKDLGENALYTATVPKDDQEFYTAFQVVPPSGYQRSSLTFTISNPDKLDFETDPWKKINTELYTEGTKTKTNNDRLKIQINLLDWNDEWPIFDPPEYETTVYETVPMGTILKTVKATDLDQEDIDFGVVHEILGSYSNEIVEIEHFGGNITTLKARAFDFEKQPEVLFQIRARDLVNHTAIAYLTVYVLDVNDEDPRITVGFVEAIEENQPDGTILNVNITASDADSTADLVFSINWDLSYATKYSRRISDDIWQEYNGSIAVKTIPSPNTNKEASAQLSFIETVKDNTPDYEKFDTIFLSLTVTDLNTEEGDGTDTSFVIINILDVNDNPPDLSANIGKTYSLQENSLDGTVIGTIICYDPDTAEVSNVSLSIEPNGNTDPQTPHWVAIDETEGTLTVLIQEEAPLDVTDDDVPVRYNLTYTVTAFDGVHTVTLDITIDMYDENENSPTLVTKTISICEDNGLHPNVTQDGNTIESFKPEDIDRDEDYHTVQCSFAKGVTEDVTRRFTVENNNLVVQLLGATLNREEIANFTFELNCVDNPNRVGTRQNSIIPNPSIIIVLQDVNDNKPVVLTKSVSFNENDPKGTSSIIEGKDDDEAENGMIMFTLTKVQRFLDVDRTKEVDVPDGLFSLVTDETTYKSATLSIAADSLENQWGYYNLTIKTEDKGSPPLIEEHNILSVVVTMYNFKDIVFEYPADGETIYLMPPTAAGPVKLYNGDSLNAISANDGGQEKYTIKYKVFDTTNTFGVDETTDKLTLVDTKYDKNSLYSIVLNANLVVTNTPKPGEAAYSKNCSINIRFFEEDTAEPAFTTHSATDSWKELDPGYQYQLPEIDYADVVILDLPKFYVIADGDKSLFSVDSKSGLVTILKPFNYKEITQHTLLVQASRSETSLDQNAPDDTKFTLTVNVIDTNSNAPVFDQDEYVGTIVTNNVGTVQVLTVSATDIDTTSQGQLQYFIDQITASNSNLGTSNTFNIDVKSGIVTSSTVIPDTVKGFYTLVIRVMDEGPEYHNTTVEATIYIVSTDNTVNFKFQNTLEKINEKTTTITTILDSEFIYYNSHVNNPTVGDDDATFTLTPIYFIDNASVPVASSEILTAVTNTAQFNKLSNLFKEEDLYLIAFQTGANSDDDMQEIFKAWLIGVCVVLGALCLILSIAFVLKTRSLNQRITKLSSTKFGSQESGLNRMGVAAPTTNKHALEGSNPVYNNEISPKDLDRVSSRRPSGDSDLIGVEDDPDFDANPPDYSSKSEKYD